MCLFVFFFVSHTLLLHFLYLCVKTLHFDIDVVRYFNLDNKKKKQIAILQLYSMTKKVFFLFLNLLIFRQKKNEKKMQ